MNDTIDFHEDLIDTLIETLQQIKREGRGAYLTECSVNFGLGGHQDEIYLKFSLLPGTSFGGFERVANKKQITHRPALPFRKLTK